MSDSEIFIVGANGQLGTALKQQYPGAQSADINEMDITKTDSVRSYDWSNIKYILNAAAYTNVDRAETQEGRVAAWSVNAEAVANLVRVAQQNDITIVHISTDYVFDGTKAPHTEDEAFSPLGVYGQSKAAGDIAISLSPKHYVLRTSWVIGEGQNFVRTMLGLGQKGVSPTVVADQVGRLTFTGELVRAIDHLITSQPAYGTYNISNGGDVCSWADITRTIFHEAGFDLAVTDTTTVEYYTGKEDIASRPLNSEFDLGKIQSTGFMPRDWHDDLREYIKKELAQ
ncbi:MAG TPA: NAD(P)-dependent oxidoreductase [Candidatus Saccharimonadales bacterium]|nr:NAD(P)-dependent oxidoreductase [Candidatus Saccharimonadales bacterium]